jgi:serine protease Do
MGVGIQDLNAALTEYFQLKDSQGVLVLEVLPEGPAEKAMLQPEDVIIKCNDINVQNTLELLKILAKTAPGQALKLKVIRNGLPRVLKITPGRRLPETDKEAPEKRAEVLLGNVPEPLAEGKTPAVPLQLWRGITVTAITPEFARDLTIEDIEGVMVTEVASKSPAEHAGIKVKDIITQINTQRIASLEDYQRAVARSSGNVLVKTNRGYLMIPE